MIFNVTDRMIHEITLAIESDIEDRSGLGDALQECDEQIRAETRSRWGVLVWQILERSLPPIPKKE